MLKKIFIFLLICIYMVYIYDIERVEAFQVTSKVTSGLVKVAGQTLGATVSDSITSQGLARLAGKALLAGVTRVAIPLGVLATVGYLVYDLSNLLNKIKSATVYNPAPGQCVYACDGAVRICAVSGEYNSCYFPSDAYYTTCDGQRSMGWCNSTVQRITGGWNDLYVTHCSVAKTTAKPYRAYYVYKGQTYKGALVSTGGVSIAVCPGGQPDNPPLTQTDIERYIENNPDVVRDIIQNQTPSQVVPYKPSDAVEVSRDDYSIPDQNITIYQNPSEQQQEDTQNPTEQPMPQPSNDDSYIDPGVPEAPSFDTSLQPPEKKSIGDLVTRFISSLPFVGALRQMQISASGSCSVSVPTPFGSSGVLDFCRYEDIFRAIGILVFQFASIYAIYIIFKRSD